MKIAINSKNGGFCLSPLAMRAYARKKGKELYAYKVKENIKKGDKYTFLQTSIYDQSGIVLFFTKDYGIGMRNPEEEYNLYVGDIERTDPDLIEVIEDLGDSANGRHAKLEIIDIPDGLDYHILSSWGDEYVVPRH